MAYGKLANKGRYGDSEIRNVAGRKSHVNKREAGLIDLYGMIGESLVQREGAGTRNPMTGMLEYYGHEPTVPTQADLYVPDITTQGDDIVQQNTQDVVDNGYYVSSGSGIFSNSGTIEENFDKEAYKQALMAGTQVEYLKQIGVPENKLEYFESNINMDELGFAQDIYSTGTQALSLQTGSSLGDIYGQTEQLQQASGLESSGSIDYAKTKATKGVMGDYLNQQKGLQTQLASSKSTFFQGAAEEFWDNLTNMDKFG